MTKLLDMVDKVLRRSKGIRVQDAPLVALNVSAAFPDNDLSLIKHLVTLRIIERGMDSPLSRRAVRSIEL